MKILQDPTRQVLARYVLGMRIIVLPICFLGGSDEYQGIWPIFAILVTIRKTEDPCFIDYKFSRQLNAPVLIDSRGYIPALPRTAVSDNEFIGTPISPGTLIGPVKILVRADEKPILPGDILVTRATDPGWTTLFLNAGGVLLETGGPLQHRASVARESCKPCIVGLDQITSRLEDGQLVELDGSTGIVPVLNSSGFDA